MMRMDRGVTNMNLINMDAFSPVKVPPKKGSVVEEIAFSIGESALGAVLIARSADGVCTILIGSEAAELEGDLATQFVDSKLVRNDRKLSDDLRKILRFIEMPSEGLELPLDTFQQRVWDELLRIPPGSIVTYGALANRIGEPGAIRAVANACGGNAIAFAIPCHRVVRSNGTLSGCRWGVARKRALLAKGGAGVNTRFQRSPCTVPRPAQKLASPGMTGRRSTSRLRERWARPFHQRCSPSRRGDRITAMFAAVPLLAHCVRNEGIEFASA
jgi:AraC family transcriptional regulator, regulatory protein of adaptative response / methylated-DNA-[protein]-cysteine methyltransferase